MKDAKGKSKKRFLKFRNGIFLKYRGPYSTAEKEAIRKSKKL